MSALDQLKTMIREDVMPMFSDAQLQHTLERHHNNLNAAAYELAIMKSENTSVSLAGLTLADTSKYFLRLASLYRPNNTGTLRG